MTIDEAIELTKQHNKCQFEESSECASIESCTDCDKYYDGKEWDEFCKQLPDLMEELKAIRKWKSDIISEFAKYDATCADEIYQKGRHDAIDEVTKFLCDDWSLDIMLSKQSKRDMKIYIELKLEQMKEGAE